MKTKLTMILCGVLLAPVFASAQTMLNVYQTVEIDAPADEVWDTIKAFDGLSSWHPVFAESVLISGENNVPGAMRRLTVKDDGPSFEEELLEWDAWDRKLRYRIVGENELPVSDYQSTIEVLRLGRNQASVIWRGQFAAKPGHEDQDVVGFITGVYRAGLDNLKQMAE